jgi:hypothetical protein
MRWIVKHPVLFGSCMIAAQVAYLSLLFGFVVRPVAAALQQQTRPPVVSTHTGAPDVAKKAEVDRQRQEKEEAQAKEQAEARRKAAADAETARKAKKDADAAKAKADAKAEADAMAKAKGVLDLLALKEGQSGPLPDREYVIISMRELSEDEFQRYAALLVRADRNVYLAVSGVSPDGLREGGKWRPAAKAVFTVLKPQPSRVLERDLPHVAQDPTTRASFTGKKTPKPDQPKDKQPAPQKSPETLGWLADWKVGDYGRCGYSPLIFQLVGKDRLLLGSRSDGPLVVLTVGSNAKIKPGTQFDLRGNLIHVTGTTTYETLKGGRKTVLAAELLPPED